MFEERSQQASSPSSTFRTAVAVILLALAIALGIWVLTIVNTTIHDAKSPAILQKICPGEGKPVAINGPGGRIELPTQFFNFVGYFLLFLFLMIPTSIALAMLKGCIALLKPDLTAKMMRGLAGAIVKSQMPKE